jgi:hypothetical protein
MDEIQKSLLEKIADIHEVPEGAYNIRSNGQLEGRNTTANIDIVTKKDEPGIDIIIKPGTKNESVHIPVILSESGCCQTSRPSQSGKIRLRVLSFHAMFLILLNHTAQCVPAVTLEYCLFFWNPVLQLLPLQFRGLSVLQSVLFQSHRSVP